MDLETEASNKLKSVYKSVTCVSHRPSLRHINSYPTNLRTATRKSGDKFWFDVTPELYERRQVEFFIYACGDASVLFVFPRLNMEHFVRHASLGGQKQVPNFTIYSDTNEREPAGHAESRFPIAGFRNAFMLIPNL